MRARHTSRFLPCLLAAALALLPRPGAAAAVEPAAGGAGEPTFSGVADVVSVDVPVNVVDRDGHPIRGLQMRDFTVYDEGAPQPVTGFEVLDLSGAAPAKATAGAPVPQVAASGNARRHFMLLFDLSFSSPTAILKARVAARDFILHSLHADDLVAVATYSLQLGPRLVVTFTPDRAQVARGIDTLGLHSPEEFLSKRDPLSFIIAAPASADFTNFAGLEGGSSAGSVVRAQRDQMLLDNMRVMAHAADRVERHFAEARISGFTRGMGDLAAALATVPGRKQIVYFSEGFDSRLMLGNDPASSEAETDTQSIQFGQIWMADSDNRYGNTQVQGELFKMLETFRRADCVVQAIDIGGLRADIKEPGGRSASNGQEMLFYVANETGGELYRNANDFGTQLTQVLARSEVTYVLTFQRSDLPTDGSYRRLKVQVKGLQVGGRVSARPGYYAPRPFKELAPLEKSLLAGDGIASAVPRRDIDVRVLVAPFRASAQLAYVPVVLEVGGDSLLAGHGNDTLDAEIYVYASDARGEMRDFFTQMVRFELSKARRILEQAGLKYYGHLDLPPGEYRIRVLVRNAQTGRTGVESLPLSIPTYTTAQPYLLPPLFMGAQQSWMMVRERTQGEAAASIVYPFTVKGEPYVPAAHPVLAASGRTDLCLVGYNLGHELTVEGQVLTAEGRPTPGGELALVERTPTGVEGLDKLIATFDPAGLAAGDYVLQVAVTDTANGNQELSSLPFTIR